MAQLAHRQRGTLEAAVVAVHEQHDFLAARDSEPPRNLGLQLLLRLFVRLDDGGYTSYAIRSDNDFIRYGRKATELRGRPELELQWIDALRRGAFLDQHVPGDVFAELDHRRSERHRTRSARGIRQVIGLLCRCAIGDEQQIERRPATVDRQLGEKRPRIRPCVEHRGRHHRVVAQPVRTKAMAAMTMADRAPGEDALAMHLGARLDMAAKQIDRGSALRPVRALARRTAQGARRGCRTAIGAFLTASNRRRQHDAVVHLVIRPVIAGSQRCGRRSCHPPCARRCR